MDFANPFDVMRVMVSHAGPGLSGAARLRSVLSVLAGGKKAAEMNFRTACEVADVFAKRLGLDETVLAALASSFERWNGRGLPTGARGTAIPRPMRVAQLSQEASRSWPASRGPPGHWRSSGPGGPRPMTPSSPISSSIRAGAGGERLNRSTPGTRPWPLPRRARRSATPPCTRRCSSWRTSPTSSPPGRAATRGLSPPSP